MSKLKSYSSKDFIRIASDHQVISDLQVDENVEFRTNSAKDFTNCIFGKIKIEAVNGPVKLIECAFKSLEVFVEKNIHFLITDSTCNELIVQGRDQSSDFIIEKSIIENCFLRNLHLTPNSLSKVHNLQSDSVVFKDDGMFNFQSFESSGSTIQNLEIGPEARSYHLKNTSIGLLKIEKSKGINLDLNGGVCGSLFLKGGKINKVASNNCQINEIKLLGDEDSLHNKLEFLDVKNPKIKIAINNEFINNLSLQGLKSYASCEIFNTHIFENLNLTNANLPQAVFNNVDLKKCKVQLNKSYIAETKFFNIDWPEDFKIDEGDLKNHQEQKEVREAYRQLKYVHHNQSNKIDAANFERNELETYLRVIIIRMGGISNRSFWANSGDYLILKSNRIFSGYGQSIWKPLLWLFIIHLILFNLLMISHEEIFTFQASIKPNWEATKNGIAAFLYFLNPIHRFTFNGEAVFSTIDFLMRLSAGYFIFYFIRASRKFHGG